jgi:hypothetical protein
MTNTQGYYVKSRKGAHIMWTYAGPFSRLATAEEVMAELAKQGLEVTLEEKP